MRVPVISGTIANENGNFLTSYPINLDPFLKDTGISEGFLAHAPGITQKASGFGADRGGVTWNGVCYRVMGTSLVKVASDWTVTVLGDVGYGGFCALTYSFANLIINSGAQLYYWNASEGLRQVTDPDLGTVIDAIFVDGYTMTTDGTSLVVTELNDPMAVNPLKYGSSEESPDAITGLVHMHGEVYAFNQNTTQVFQNIGGSGFPFQTVKTATVPYGCVAPRAKCKYIGSVAFVGSGENEGLGVYLLGAGVADKISPQEVDDELAALSDAELAEVVLEARVERDDQRLLVHLPNRTWVFSAQTSKKSSIKTWCQYVTGTGGSGRYEGRGLALAYGYWIVGSSTGKIGVLDRKTTKHYGEATGWQFDTVMLYNEANRGILTGIELIGTPGRSGPDTITTQVVLASFGTVIAGPVSNKSLQTNHQVFFSYSKDGETWSMERGTSLGKLGERRKRIAWRPGIRFETMMSLRFRGASDSLAAIARLECDLEPLGA